MVYFAICIGIIILDLATKYWAKTGLSKIGSIPLWEGVLHLTYVENRGAAFGILQNQKWFFIGVAALAVGAIAFAMHKFKNKSKILSLGLSFLAAGAVGNMTDRIVLGFVVDLFDFRLIDFPVFNVADIFVCIGAALVAIFVIFIEDKLTKKPKESDADAD